MKRGTANIADLRLPAEDGTISRALDDLKGKLSQWIESVAAVESTIAACADKCLDAATTAASTTDQPKRPPQTLSPQDLQQGLDPTQDQCQKQDTDSSDNEEDASRNISQSIHTSIVAREQNSPSSSQGDETLEKTDALRILRKAMSSETPLGDDSSVTEAAEKMDGDDSAQSVMSESEALLHSLEPDIAKVVRVQYRLFNGRKSIQELIDEYEKTPAPEKPKSWWERIKR